MGRLKEGAKALKTERKILLPTRRKSRGKPKLGPPEMSLTAGRWVLKSQAEGGRLWIQKLATSRNTSQQKRLTPMSVGYITDGIIRKSLTASRWAFDTLVFTSTRKEGATDLQTVKSHSLLLEGYGKNLL